MTRPAASTAAAVSLRSAAALAALAAGVGAIVVVALLVRATPGPRAAAVEAPAPAQEPGFPAPPRGAFVLAREVGTDAVALAVIPGTPLGLQASVVGPDGAGVAGLRVAFVVGGRRLPAVACGPGCYRASVSAAAPRRIVVMLPRAAVPFALPRLPAPDATAIVARAARVWRGLRTLVSHERLASSPTNALHTVYRFQAPDRLAYTIRGRSAAVVIGGTRWDRSAPGAAWQRSAQTSALRQPTPFWASAVDAHVVGAGTLRGRPVLRVSFFDPQSSAWFLVAIERRSYRTLDVRMVAASHFMHDAYGSFDAPLRIVPPS